MTDLTREPQRKPLPTKLFLETSAQIQRLVGTKPMQDGINALIYAEPKPAIGTSATVKREFKHICDVFRELDQAARTLPKPAAALIPFDDLLLEIKGQVGQYYPGGPELLLYIYTKLSAKFGRRLFTVNRVRAVLKAFKNQLKIRFLEDELFDKSSCGVWGPEGSCSCDSKPGAQCKLAEIIVENREAFIATATTLANANRDESPRLKRILERIKVSQGKELSGLLGKHRAHVGDLIIFWEVPDGWTILSRDLTFKILKEHRPEVDFFMVRLPRITSDTSCKILIGGMPTEAEGTLLNHNEKGARISAPSVTVKKGQRVTVTSPELPSERSGDVSEFPPGADREPQSSFGLRFKIRKS